VVRSQFSEVSFFLLFFRLWFLGPKTSIKFYLNDFFIYYFEQILGSCGRFLLYKKPSCFDEQFCTLYVWFFRCFSVAFVAPTKTTGLAELCSQGVCTHRMWDFLNP
jgi:hypothetical protein